MTAALYLMTTGQLSQEKQKKARLTVTSQATMQPMERRG
jgi:hypothetical protein